MEGLGNSSSSSSSLVKLVCSRHVEASGGGLAVGGGAELPGDNGYGLPWSSMEYDPESYVGKRMPSEIEAVLATIDQGALDLIQKSFGQKALDLHAFVQAIVQAGVYNAEKVLSFIGGVVDLFYEVLRSQPLNPLSPVTAETARKVFWSQVVNYFIESPEIARFESSQSGLKTASTSAAERDARPEMFKARFVDRGKHCGQSIEKIFWEPFLDKIATIELGGDSVFFWSPSIAEETAQTVTPKIPEMHYEVKNAKELEFDLDIFSVRSVAWDRESRVLTAILSNKRICCWHLSSREKFIWSQRQQLQTEHLQEDIWWNELLKLWVTTDADGLLSFWKLNREEDGAVVKPTWHLHGHTKKVTAHLEVQSVYFATASLDRVVILWDCRSGVEAIAPDVRCEDHQASVLSLAYIHEFSTLISVACEKLVYIWTFDASSFRGFSLP